MPDLALVPVLAELFGVSCDELLRGERKPEPDAAEVTPLGEKRKKWLLERAKRRFSIFCIISGGADVVVFILLLAINEILPYRPTAMAAMIGVAVCAAGAIAVIAALVSALSTVSGFETDELTGKFKLILVRRAEALLGFSAVTGVPLMGYGVTGDWESLIFGGAAALAAAVIISLAVNRALKLRGYFGNI